MHTGVHTEATRHEPPSGKQATQNSPSSEADTNDTGTDTGSIATSIVGYIEKNPLVATAAALALGAAVVMAVRSRGAANNRLDRRAAKVARSMERTFAKEMRALRNSEFGNRAEKMGQSFGDAIGKVDLAALVDLGKNYVEAARNRMKV